jgi:uncharacterized protein (TIGR02996 family)
MHDESDFLRKLLENPADDTTRLVYADWLDEHDDEESQAKAKFLRVTVHLMGPIQRVGWRKKREIELQQLAAKLPTDWLAVVSRLKVESCGAKRATNELWERYQRQFDFVCDKRWDEMTTTEDNTVRHCEQCKENVHYCDTITDAREHAQQGHCVAVDLGIIRRAGDLDPPVLMMGRISPAAYEREQNRLEPDAVSREREERKRKQSEGEAESAE